METRFDTLWIPVLRVAGLSMALWEFFINNMANPEVLLVAGPMMGLANLLKQEKDS